MSVCKINIQNTQRIFRCLLLLLALFSGFLHSADSPILQLGQKQQSDNLFPQVKVETALGDILIELDRYRAPITSNNFLGYVVSGRYDGTIFHRVVADFVVQAGGYDQLFNPRPQDTPIFNESGNGLRNQQYSIAMAREDDPHSATNQFYFNLADNEGLDPGKSWGYAVFGWVVEGSEILDRIGRTPVAKNDELDWEDVPKRSIIIKKVVLLEEN